MLPSYMVKEIRSRLASGVAYRQIARELGVARGTVHAIARHRYRWRLTQREREELENPEIPQGPHRRCERCGQLVRHPCLRCRLEEECGEYHPIPMVWRENPLGLELRKEHQRRYEEIRSRRHRQESEEDWESRIDYRSPHLYH
ncbi:MAG: hypothetical protein PHE53_06235 [Thermoguttaceae bacterium]|nr:hypothetical protein [Thermoguttaceae bacterium]